MHLLPIECQHVLNLLSVCFSVPISWLHYHPDKTWRQQDNVREEHHNSETKNTTNAYAVEQTII